MIAPVLIVAIGNESRGDDALGPLLLRKLHHELINRLDQFELLEEFQLQIEHATDLQGRQLILFIDAGINTPAPFDFYRIQADENAQLFSHSLTPEALLKVYTQLYLQASPATFVLCIRGDRFELGDELSPHAMENLEMAFEFSRKILQIPEIVSWVNSCTH